MGKAQTKLCYSYQKKKQNVYNIFNIRSDLKVKSSTFPKPILGQCSITIPPVVLGGIEMEY